MGRNAQALSGQIQPGAKPFKDGGKVKHTDIAEDKKLIAKMIKTAEKKEPAGKKSGGKIKGCCK